MYSGTGTAVQLYSFGQSCEVPTVVRLSGVAQQTLMVKSRGRTGVPFAQDHIVGVVFLCQLYYGASSACGSNYTTERCIEAGEREWMNAISCLPPPHGFPMPTPTPKSVPATTMALKTPAGGMLTGRLHGRTYATCGLFTNPTAYPSVPVPCNCGAGYSKAYPYS